MNIILNLMAICCFLSNLFFLLSKIDYENKNREIIVFIIRVIGAIGVTTPILFWLK